MVINFLIKEITNKENEIISYNFSIHLPLAVCLIFRNSWSCALLKITIIVKKKLLSQQYLILFSFEYTRSKTTSPSFTHYTYHRYIEWV